MYFQFRKVYVCQFVSLVRIKKLGRVDLYVGRVGMWAELTSGYRCYIKCETKQDLENLAGELSL